MIRNIISCIIAVLVSINGYAQDFDTSKLVKKESFIIGQQEIREHGIIGKLFLPISTEQRPAVIVLVGPMAVFIKGPQSYLRKKGTSLSVSILSRRRITSMFRKYTPRIFFKCNSLA